MFDYQTSNNYNSAFTGFVLNGSSFTGTYEFPEAKYYDKYSYGTSAKEYTRGKLGDATKEMAPTDLTGNWYSDYALFSLGSNPWFLRSGRYFNASSSGIFSFNYERGIAASGISTRAVLVIK